MLRGASARNGHTDEIAGASQTMREDRDASQLPQLETANEYGKRQRLASEDTRVETCNRHTRLTSNDWSHSNTHLYLNVDVNWNSFRC